MRGENTPRGREMVLEMSLRWIAKPGEHACIYIII